MTTIVLDYNSALQQVSALRTIAQGLRSYKGQFEGSVQDVKNAGWLAVQGDESRNTYFISRAWEGNVVTVKDGQISMTASNADMGLAADMFFEQCDNMATLIEHKAEALESIADRLKAAADRLQMKQDDERAKSLNAYWSSRDTGVSGIGR